MAGGGGIPCNYNGLHEEELLERGTFFRRLQVYERVGISSVSVLEGFAGKSVIAVCEGSTRRILWLKVKQTSCFSNSFILKGRCTYRSKKECIVLNWYVKGVYNLSIKGTRKGSLSVINGI